MIFFQRGDPWFWSKKWTFFQLFYLDNIDKKNVFYDIVEPRNAFLGLKNKKFKKSKNWHFSMEWSMELVQKWPFFQLFFLGNLGPKNVFYDNLERKNAFLGQKNKKFKKFKKWHFSKGVNPWLWSKNGHLSNFFFRQDRPGKCLLRDSRTKKRLSRPEYMKFKQSKNWLFFLEGLT